MSLPEIGDSMTVLVTNVATGGMCVGRHEGRVVFVRHSLPGETVRAQVTEVRDSYLRADAVQILLPSPDRVDPVCPYAGPGRCGGCDFQHATASAQRAMKATVVAEQLRRLAGLDRAVEVEALPGGLLGWRTRITYAVDIDGCAGLHRHRSDEIEAVDRCLLGVPGVGDSPALARRWPGLSGVEVVAGEGDKPGPALVAHRPARRPAHQRARQRGRRLPDRVEVIDGPERVTHAVGPVPLEVSAAGFWQSHRDALDTFSAALLELLDPQPGERVLELYSGAGALTVSLAGAVGPTGSVATIESSSVAVTDARANLAAARHVCVIEARVDPESIQSARRGLGVEPDLIVLDPPRAGAGAEVMQALCALAPRLIGYLSCDPASLARDIAVAQRAGWRLGRLRAFDAFPMTHHVECLAVLEPPAP